VWDVCPAAENAIHAARIQIQVNRIIID